MNQLLKKLKGAKKRFFAHTAKADTGSFDQFHLVLCQPDLGFFQIFEDGAAAAVKALAQIADADGLGGKQQVEAQKGLTLGGRIAVFFGKAYFFQLRRLLAVSISSRFYHSISICSMQSFKKQHFVFLFVHFYFQNSHDVLSL